MYLHVNIGSRVHQEADHGGAAAEGGAVQGRVAVDVGQVDAGAAALQDQSARGAVVEGGGVHGGGGVVGAGVQVQVVAGSMRLTHKKTVISHKLCAHF